MYKRMSRNRESKLIISQIILITRFNLQLPNTKWSKESKCLDAEYLHTRFDIFEKYTVPSIALQTDNQLKWLVLFHENTPSEFAERISICQSKCPNMIPVYLTCEEMQRGAEFIGEIIRKYANSERVVSVRIDNDDVIHPNFISSIREIADKSNGSIKVISFEKGLQYDFYKKDCINYYCENNHFLAVIHDESDTNVFSFPHSSLSEYFESSEVYVDKRRIPYWVEIISGTNVVNHIEWDPRRILVPQCLPQEYPFVEFRWRSSWGYFKYCVSRIPQAVCFVMKKIRKSTLPSRMIRKMKENALYFFYCIIPYRRMVKNSCKQREEIIVSLTSYPKRFETLHVCLKSLMYQSIRPNRVILNIQNGIEQDDIPKTVLHMRKYGLEIEYGQKDIKGHKKYFSTIANNPNSIVITVDDDGIYHRDTLRELMQTHGKYPEAVCAKRVRKIGVDENGLLIPYAEWCRNSAELLPSHQLVGIGVGGILYPPGSLPKETFNVEQITQYALEADDLWLKCMEIRNGVKVVRVDSRHPDPVNIRGSQSTGLWMENVDNSANDRCINRLATLLNIKWGELLRINEKS